MSFRLFGVLEVLTSVWEAVWSVWVAGWLFVREAI